MSEIGKELTIAELELMRGKVVALSKPDAKNYLTARLVNIDKWWVHFTACEVRGPNIEGVVAFGDLVLERQDDGTLSDQTSRIQVFEYPPEAQ